MVHRFQRVLDYIDAHLDDELTLEVLSAVAGLSRYHFHRQFSQQLGIGVHKYVQLVRFRRASYELAFREHPILDIALGSGYESHEAFSRAFKKAVGQAPSSFRSQPAWAPWFAAQERLREVRARAPRDLRLDDVRIESFPATRVAALEHRGDAALLGASLQRFIAWRRLARLPPRTSATFNLVYDAPADVPPAAFRFDVCAATGRAVEPNPFGVVERVIPGGRCAVLRHVGPDDALFRTVDALYATWLPSSGEELRDAPLFLERVRFFPDVRERDAVTEIFLPLQACAARKPAISA
ncbi:MAG: AraC family transcriptional regulator [Kofleriaceae bacterium]